MFKVETGYYLELLMPEKITLLGSTKSKLIKDENVPPLEDTEVVLAHCNIVNNHINMIQKCSILFFLKYCLVSY